MNGDAPPIDGVEADDLAVPSFRAIKVDASRRGIRLEKIFWAELKDAAAAQAVSLNGLIAQRARQLPEGANLASDLRVEAMRFARQDRSRLRERASTAAAADVVQACPSPAVMLSSDKKLLAFNQAFLEYLRSRLSLVSGAVNPSGLRLSLDTPFAELIASLKSSHRHRAATGFAIVFDQRVIQGQMNAALAPVGEVEALLGFVVQK